MTKTGVLEGEAGQLRQATFRFFEIFDCCGNLHASTVNACVRGEEDTAIPVPEKRDLPGAMTRYVNRLQLMVKREAVAIGDEVIDSSWLDCFHHSRKELKHDPVSQAGRGDRFAKSSAGLDDRSLIDVGVDHGPCSLSQCGRAPDVVWVTMGQDDVSYLVGGDANPKNLHAYGDEDGV